MSGHDLFNPDDLTPPYGFSHGALAKSGRTLHIAGQTGHHPDLSIHDGLVEQFARACQAMARVIEEAGGQPDDLVSLTIYTSELGTYRENLGPIGAAYREVFGRHFPPMALIGVSELFDPRSVVELVGVAVIASD